jgi:molybdate transport system permease protein
VTRTLPLEIYLQRETDADAAVALSLVLVAVAVTVVALAYRGPRASGRPGAAGSESTTTAVPGSRGGIL